MKTTTLIVAGLTPDKYKGQNIAQINADTMKKIGVNSGEIIAIVGKRKTVVTTIPASNVKEGTIHVDETALGNVGLTIGQEATIQINPPLEIATKIVIAPIDMRLNVDDEFTNFVKKRRFVDHPFCEGQEISVIMLNHHIPFDVARTFPREVPVQATEETKLIIFGNPLPKHAPETIFNIKYLLRWDWLHNLMTRIHATKTVFSIPGYNIAEEEEQKIIEIAKGIAENELSNIDVNLTFKSDDTTLGTLPWLEVDVMGNIASIYPDIQLPPPIALSFPRESGKTIPVMRRCFKTGVEKCPKEINFSPKSVVVAMPFGGTSVDTYKFAIRPALEESGLKPWKADEQISNIDIMCKICHAIQECGFLLADISSWNPNVVFELGLAYGLGKNVILVKHEKSEVPVDLKGLEYVGYGTIDDLKRNLFLFLKGVNLENI